VIRTFEVPAGGPGLTEITAEVRRLVRLASWQEGLCTLFVQHTSASLLIQENADPSARRDLERWFERLVPENDPLFTHTAVSLSIPVVDGDLALGTWQGIFLFEHRRHARARTILVHLGA
jgi:thiamine phosphate synthase YjbQ (UPF0047 family)